MKLKIWDAKTAEVELRKKLEYAKESRKKSQEKQWKKNETLIFHTGEGIEALDSMYEEIDGSSVDMSVSYAFKNLRFLHAQMSANPPSVTVGPTSNDQEDRRKAEAADQLVNHGLRVYNLTERVDATTLNTLIYGTGFCKNTWNVHKGDILEMDKQSGEIVLEGDVDITVPSIWSVFPDPDAEVWEDVRYVFEEKVIPYEDAMYYWPQYQERLQKFRIQNSDAQNDTVKSELNEQKRYYDSVVVYEYWEKGLPHNGYLGRFCICLGDGTPLTKVGPSPFRFTQPGKISAINSANLSDEIKEAKINRLPEVAQLPYSILTEVDVPNSIWGKSSLEYAGALQGILNSLDTMTLDNVQAVGTAHMILPEGAEVADDALSDTPWDIVKITGSQPPHFMQPAQLMPDMSTLREKTKMGIDDMMGVNEAMFGQQSREQSGASMQYATNQGNMIRRRLFNKYRLFVESLYKGYLNIVRKHWNIERTVNVVGKEKIIHAVDLKGADIDGGFDLEVAYGTSLSLDPSTRREEILSMIPLLKESGISPRQLLKYMKLNELDNMYDDLSIAENRQREIFEEMILNKKYIQPREHQDHDNMLIYAKRWVMSAEFKALEEGTKQLVEQHIQDRAQVQAQSLAPPMGAGGPMNPGPAGAPGAMPQVPSADAQATAGQVAPLNNG